MHAGLIALACVLEKIQHFSIDAQRDLLLGVRQLGASV